MKRYLYTEGKMPLFNQINSGVTLVESGGIWYWSICSPCGRRSARVRLEAIADTRHVAFRQPPALPTLPLLCAHLSRFSLFNADLQFLISTPDSAEIIAMAI